MTFDSSPERFGISLVLVLVAALFLFWTRRRVQSTTTGRLQLVVACVTGLAYGLFRVWVGCGLVTPLYK